MKTKERKKNEATQAQLAARYFKIQASDRISRCQLTSKRAEWDICSVAKASDHLIVRWLSGGKPRYEVVLWKDMVSLCSMS